MKNFSAAYLRLCYATQASPLISLCASLKPFYSFSQSSFGHIFCQFAFITRPLDLSLRLCLFSSTMDNLVSISGSSCPSSMPYTVNIGESLSIIDCQFTDAQNFNYYIFCNCSSSSVFIRGSSFTDIICLTAWATLYINLAYNITVMSSVFQDCQTEQCLSYEVHSNDQAIPYGTMNDTTEVLCGNIKNTLYSSFFGANTHSIFTGNNASWNSVLSYRTGFCFTNSPSSYPIATFSQVSCCTGASFVSFYAGSISNTLCIQCLTFVNNSVFSSWIEIGSASTANFSLCTFYKNNETNQFVDMMWDSCIFSIFFVECIFDRQAPIQSSSISCSNCRFSRSVKVGFNSMTCNAQQIFSASKEFTSSPSDSLIPFKVVLYGSFLVAVVEVR